MRQFVFIVAAALALAACKEYGGLPEGEPSDPKAGNPAGWEAMAANTGAAFGSIDLRYAHSEAPDTTTFVKEWEATAWRGEKVHAQLVVWSRKPLRRVSVDCHEALLSENGGTIPAANVSIGMLRYLLTDSLRRSGSSCGLPPLWERDSLLVADAIEPRSQCSMKPFTVRPFWLSLTVPHDTPPGIYRGKAEVKADGLRFILPFTVTVSERTLPPAPEWSFHLDLWQNPFSVSRYYGVEPWSNEHFTRLRPYMEMLAAAGQKSVTVSMIHDPWNGQTYDIYYPMIRWIKHADGGWSYDYSIYDRWVEFMESVGIKSVVNCYSMVPWNNRFYYYDEASGRDSVLVTKTGTAEYIAHWKPMLTDFAQHLRTKGWFHKTAIAMDERPEADMKAVIALVRSVDPEFLISLAGNYHDPIRYDIYDYCIALAENYPVDLLRERLARGWPTTFYTCCAERHPNTFTCSPPAEAAWMAWHAAAMGYSGYLRWAYNCWPRNPLHDTRFGPWTGGDTYLVYPGLRSSVRFERLVEGIQNYEKVAILRQTLGADERAVLEAALEGFRVKDPATVAATAAEHVRAAQKVVNSF